MVSGKHFIRASILILPVIAIGCYDHYQPDCSRLNGGIINLSSAVVKPVIDKLTSDLNAKDDISQKANLDILASRLNSHCSNLSAVVICYACIYSIPPQSSIRVQADSAGVRVTRIINIWTPSNGTLKWAGIH